MVKPCLRGRGWMVRYADDLVMGFVFPGFTHAWATSKNGAPDVQRQTASKKFTKGLAGIRGNCRNDRTRPLCEQWQALCQRLRGHAPYFGIIGNSRRVSSFAYEVRSIWRFWLNRRSSQRDMTWERFYSEICPRSSHCLPRAQPAGAPSEPSLLKNRMC